MNDSLWSMPTGPSPDPVPEAGSAIRLDKVPASRLFAGFGGAFLVLTAVSAVFFYASHQQLREAEGMTAVATATVVAVDRTTTNNGHTRNVVYRWTYKGRTFQHEGMDYDSALSKGDRTRVRFNPHDSKFVVHQGSWRRWEEPVALAFGGLIFVFIDFLVVVTFRTWWRLRAKQIARARELESPGS